MVCAQWLEAHGTRLNAHGLWLMDYVQAGARPRPGLVTLWLGGDLAIWLKLEITLHSLIINHALDR